MSVKKLRKSQKSERQAEVQVKEGHEIGQSLSMIGPYLVFVISFTQAGFSKTKLHPKERLTAPKTLKMTLKSQTYAFLHSIWKNLHLTEFFYTDTVCGVCDKYEVWIGPGQLRNLKYG